MILFIALPETQDKADPVATCTLHLLPRRCPLCSDDTIIGHGQRRKQAHDQCHDWIWVRRGICHPCSKTFTILPDFALARSIHSSPMGITAHVQAEFKWITDVSFFGKVEVFTNPEGTGTPIVTRLSVDPAGQPVAALIQDIIVPVGPALAPDTGYFFRVTATDPTGNNPDLVTPAPLPPFFTGTQAIGSVSVAPDINSAVISWTANVIGYGSVVYGTTSLNQGPVEDTYNITTHAIQLTGLSLGGPISSKFATSTRSGSGTFGGCQGRLPAFTRPYGSRRTRFHSTRGL